VRIAMLRACLDSTPPSTHTLTPRAGYPDQTAQEKHKCMQTVAARAINDLFREHAFQLAITFHGMQAIAYEWGSPIHPKSGHKDVSPDDAAQKQMGAALAMYGGGGRYGRKYTSAPMNSLVYPVFGGMEDWAYAATWDLKEPGAGHKATVSEQAPSAVRGGARRVGARGMDTHPEKASP